MYCPKCGSQNIHTISDYYRERGGFSGCLACIGYLLFSWVGILCGFCGSKNKSEHRITHICQNCGTRF